MQEIRAAIRIPDEATKIINNSKCKHREHHPSKEGAKKYSLTATLFMARTCHYQVNTCVVVYHMCFISRNNCAANSFAASSTWLESLMNATNISLDA